jgi:hypothetical protein
LPSHSGLSALERQQIVECVRLLAQNQESPHPLSEGAT